MRHGNANTAAGLLFMAGFMVCGFALIYLRDFAPVIVLIGGIAMVVAVAWLGVAVARLKSWPDQDENVRI